MGGLSSSFFHGTVPRTFVVRSARDWRAFLIGRRSTACIIGGNSVVMSTETRPVFSFISKGTARPSGPSVPGSARVSVRSA